MKISFLIRHTEPTVSYATEKMPQTNSLCYKDAGSILSSTINSLTRGLVLFAGRRDAFPFHQNLTRPYRLLRLEMLGVFAREAK